MTILCYKTSQNCKLRSSLVGKYMKIMLVNDELCQKYASKFC